jgi:hypothetical protein
MLLLGPGIAPERRIDRPVPITAVAATGLEFLGLAASPGAKPSGLAAARACARKWMSRRASRHGHRVI